MIEPVLLIMFEFPLALMPMLSIPVVRIDPLFVIVLPFESATPAPVLIAAELTVMMLPVLMIVLLSPVAEMPRELLPAVLIVPLFMILFDPPVA